MTLSQKLLDLHNAKQSIKAALETKGVSTAGVPFTDYGTKIGEISGEGGGSSSPTYTTWTRPSEWLTIPTVNADQGVCLVAVSPYGKNYETIRVKGSSGTIDWGDGTVDNYTSDVTIEHQYDYANVPAGTELANGDRQAIVTITATSGSTTVVYFNIPPSYASNFVATNWLEIHLNFPTATDYEFGNVATQSALQHYRCEYVNIIDCAEVINFNGMFKEMYALKKVDITQKPLIPTGGFNLMFQNCYNLLEAPLFSMGYSPVSNSVEGMFTNCYSLETIPAYDFTNNTTNNFQAMFNGCRSLRDIPHFDTSRGVYFASMFNGCQSITTIPAFDLSNAITMQSMFFQCNSLNTIPYMNTSSVTNWTNTFYGCQALEYLPELDFSANTGSQQTFYGCYSLTRLPASFAGFKASTMSSFFRDCYSLQEVPAMDTTASTTSLRAFYNCRSLRKVGAMDFSPISSASGLNQMFTSCVSLHKLEAYGIDVSFNISGGNFWENELNEIFTNLATVTGQTITITGNPGAAGCDRTIAENKGWTVVG